MFAEDLGMQSVEEGRSIFYDLPKRHSDVVTRPDGPRDIGGLNESGNTNRDITQEQSNNSLVTYVTRRIAHWTQWKEYQTNINNRRTIHARVTRISSNSNQQIGTIL